MRDAGAMRRPRPSKEISPPLADPDTADETPDAAEKAEAEPAEDISPAVAVAVGRLSPDP